MAENLLNLAHKHYENFPVGSWLLPKKYREPIHLIYAFARVADDIADEGMQSPEVRIRQIDEWEQMLLQSTNGSAPDSFFRKLAEVIEQFGLPHSYFQDLLIAFRRDSANPHYETFNEVLDYCRYSANPIGRLLLKLFNCSNDENEQYSDKICTALQLTNFWQDISVDTRRNRFYIATTDLQRFDLTFSDILRNEKRNEFRQMMKLQVERTRRMFKEGEPLLSKVNPHFRKELRFIYLGGSKILDKIELLDFDTSAVRPALTKLGMLSLAAKSFIS
ncbi:MAG: squalene synthase HpnC [Ignavibacteriales bacterium]|nr:squalene synthase HpnC [Ignavibacteriales bacterium]